MPSRHSRKLEHSPESLLLEHAVDIIEITIINIGIYPKIASLLYAVIYVLIIYVPASYLFKKKIFIKL